MRLAAFLLCLATPALAQPAADIVVLGEVHDNPEAHLGQAAMIATLQPTAVVFEMLTAEEGARADADRSVIAQAWEASGWRDYPIYAPIFDALGAGHIVGAAATRDTVRAVYADGAAALFGPDAPLYGLDQPLLAAQQTARETMQFDAHCAAMPLEMMGSMVEIQRYRDAVFARAVLAALDTYGAPVVLIAGNGHARTDWGVPAMIAQAAPGVTVHAVGFIEAESDVPFDDIRIVPPAPRDDPCAALLSDKG